MDVLKSEYEFRNPTPLLRSLAACSSHVDTVSTLILQGFQGKNGPPGPSGVVGPQVRGLARYILVDCYAHISLVKTACFCMTWLVSGEIW